MCIIHTNYTYDVIYRLDQFRGIFQICPIYKEQHKPMYNYFGNLGYKFQLFSLIDISLFYPSFLPFHCLAEISTPTFLAIRGNSTILFYGRRLLVISRICDI